MTVVNKPNGFIRIVCDLCPTSFQDTEDYPILQAAKDLRDDGWKMLKHDKDHYSNLCPDCVAKIKED